MNKNLSLSDNYLINLNSTIIEIYSGYIELLKEYINFFIENTFIQDSTYFNYVFIKGIETLNNVFKLLLLYTKNLDLTCYHCQKSFYYYIEFIGQIGDSNHQFLQLNSKDAALFVYKKTIFEINNDFRKTYTNPQESELEKFNLIENLIYHSFIIISGYVKNLESQCDKNSERNNLIKNLISIIKLIKKIPINNIYNSNEKLKTANNIIEKLIIQGINLEKLIFILDNLYKKFLKNNVNLNKINKIILTESFLDNYNNFSSNKFINWLTSM